MNDSKHIPVLANEILYYLNPQKGQNFIDATLGLGGHSKLILNKITPGGLLIGFECDKENAERAKKNLINYKKSIIIFRNNYSTLKESLNGSKIKDIHGIIFDLGISSVQLDNPERGLTFRSSGPLDMRLDQETELTAYEIVNHYEREEIKNIIKKYGEEPDAGLIAKKIVEQRSKKPIETTEELAKLIQEIKKPKRWGGGHEAALTFQALRIAVNDELAHLEKGLKEALEIISNKGRIAVISFHSLEDRIVKRIFKEAVIPCKCPKELPKCICGGEPEFKLITKKPIYPTKEEIENNPRSRSAKLRIIEKI